MLKQAGSCFMFDAVPFAWTGSFLCPLFCFGGCFDVFIFIFQPKNYFSILFPNKNQTEIKIFPKFSHFNCSDPVRKTNWRKYLPELLFWPPLMVPSKHNLIEQNSNGPIGPTLSAPFVLFQNKIIQAKLLGKNQFQQMVAY